MYPNFNVNLGPIKLSQVTKLVSGEFFGKNKKIEFNNLVGLDDIINTEHTLSFVYENYKDKISVSRKTNLIVSTHEKNKFSEFENLIVVNNVHEAVAKLSSLFYRDINDDDLNLHNKTEIGANSYISNKAIIKKGVKIGKNCTIKDGAIINNNCILGNNTSIDENVVLSNAIIGDNVRIGRNSSIGQPGFGFAINNLSNYKIYHLGRVILQNNVSIGSNCCIDRGSFGDTIIGENSFFDNLCHIAHNVVVGNNCVFAAMAGIAGSTKIGNSVLAGGQVGVSGHLTIGNNVQIAAKSAVLQSVQDDLSVMGNPAIDKYKYIRKYKKFYGK